MTVKDETGASLAARLAPQARTISWDAADGAKLFLCLLVVMLHTAPFGPAVQSAIRPLYRIAVPLFFLITSVLFFARDGGSREWGEASGALLHTVSRIVRLYLFWFVVLLPVTLVYWRAWMAQGPLMWLMHWAVAVPFGTTFGASWYLSATVIGLAAVVCLRTRLRLSDSAMLVVSLLFYIFCLATSSYSWLLGERWMSFWSDLSSWWIPVNSFPVAVSWIALGSVLADRMRRIPEEPLRKPAKMGALAVFALGMVGIVAEYLLIVSGGGSSQTDVLALLPVPVISAMRLLLRSEVRLPHAREMRRLSTVVYCMHYSVNVVARVVLSRLSFVFPQLGIPFGRFLIVLATCIAAYLLLRCLSKVDGLRWLRYSW